MAWGLTRKPYRGDRKVISFRAKGYWTVVAMTAGVLAGLSGFFSATIAAEKKPPTAPAGMVLVEGGSFQMGDLFGDGKSWQPETPVHEVVVDSFYIARHEVTFGQFKEFADATGYRTSAEKREGAYSQSPFETHWKLLGYKQADNEPVLQMSWNDAAHYCNWLSRKEGLPAAYAMDDVAAEKVTGTFCAEHPTALCPIAIALSWVPVL